MRISRLLRALSISALTFALYAAAHAQSLPSKCVPPEAAAAAASGPNIFTEEQEAFLGDAMAERIQKDYRLVEDEEVTGFLARIGRRLLEHLPLKQTRLRFFVVDLSDVNAFVLPGGRIYVSRKLVAYARSEDELAAVISHELGHLASHETGVDMTRLFKEVLGVAQVGDRRDVVEKYNQLMESFRLKPGAFKRGDRERGQVTADLIGFYALTAAGYDPAAESRFWDRVTETKGKTGGLFSDLFGTTRPEEKRLREMLKAASQLPPECVPKRAAEADEEFKRWQSSVIAYTGLGRRESLRGVLSKTQLSPRLQSDIRRLRFSPDGKYVLAQDDSGVTVLTREPFAPVFRAEAEDARAAQFTPDSKALVFHTSNLRVERWDIEEQRQADVKEVVVRKGCLQSSLSPDGKYLACFGPQLDLNLIDVSTGQSVLRKSDFWTPTYAGAFAYSLFTLGLDGTDAGQHFISMAFSPDARYFVAAAVSRGSLDRLKTYVNTAAVELPSMAKVSLPDSLESLISDEFTFVGAARVVGVNPSNYRKSAMVSFPDGKPLAEFPLGGRLEGATRGDYVFTRPFKEFAVAVLDINRNVFSKVSEKGAMDIFGDEMVAELRNGEVGLYKLEKSQLVASAVLPDSSLGRLRVAEMSPDTKLVALSTSSRGGVWDVSTGRAALYLRGFRGAYLGAGGHFYADFPKFEAGGQKAERNVVDFNLANGDAAQGQTIEDDAARQAGPYLVTAKSAKKGDDDSRPDLRRNILLEILDARTLAPVWSKPYPKESPRVWVSPRQETVALVWDVTDEAAKDEIKADPKLSAQLSAMKEKEGDYLVEVLDAKDGARKGSLLIETGKGSFRLKNVYAAGDRVVVTDNLNRVLVYSLATGEQKGRAFGNYAAVSETLSMMCVENERGKIAVYDLATMEKRDELVFSNPVSMLRFSGDGRRLLVLTSNQTVYVIDAAALAGARAASN
ncbi:MAG TPA: M48 family metallopeptidase [Pyrinomonadaceae bacterium]|jgi:WD40 repeat protein|nr:M48 family metallopeptidase [Pyrinomonadaceae bacterium]